MYWKNVVPITDFIRFLPTEGGAPVGFTEVRFLQDEKKIIRFFFIKPLKFTFQRN